MERFLNNASDNEYLLQKVIFIVGVFGGCRIGELVVISVDDVEDRSSAFVVQIPDMKTHKPRIFNIINANNSVPAANVFRKYRIFTQTVVHQLQEQKCTLQTVRVSTFSTNPRKIAHFLALENPEEYTGHSFRRSSAVY